MSVLTKEVIWKEINEGRIKIEPLIHENIGPGSIDLTLSNQIRVSKDINEVIHVNEETDYKQFTELIEIQDFYMLKPGESILGMTNEKITLPDNICGWLQGRSRFSRLGLMVHITASFVQPGVSNKQILEIFNASPFSMHIYPGTKICQLILQRTEGNARYEGMFKEQEL